MSRRETPIIALVWAQFAAYHVDRCEYVAQHLGERAQVLALEVASASDLYAWEASGGLAYARKLTLFPGSNYDAVSRWRRFRAMLSALRGCDHVFLGIGYNEPEVVALSFILRLLGVHVIMMTDSKFEDFPRSVAFEAFKALLLTGMRAALVAGHRQVAYVRFLGFGKRPIRLGYDVVDTARVRAQAGGTVLDADTPFADRPFLFVGRFVAKKNILHLLDGYAAYAGDAESPRRLVLAGSGVLESDLRAHAEKLGVAGLIDWPGFLTAGAVARQMRTALALLLLSTEEQWGLVINEAVAVGLPAVISQWVGAGDVLLRNLLNGYVVTGDCVPQLAQAMRYLAADEASWRAMAGQSLALSQQGDVSVFAQAVQDLAAIA